MRFANVGGRAALVSPSGSFVDVAAATGGEISADPMQALVALDRLRDVQIPPDATELDGRELRAPVPRPGKVLGAGINYFEHAREAGFDIPTEPLLFAKLPSSICGPSDEIVMPDGRFEVDWEAEVVVVVGRRGRHIAKQDAWSYVAGLTAGQDISDRAEQFRSLRQFTMGKSFDTYAPIGPVVVTPDEFTNPEDIRVSCFINGENVQDGRTGDCIFTIPELLCWASQICTLEPGDLIFTGTPSGVGYIRQPPRFLRPDDILETDIESIGRLENRCVAGPAYVQHTYDRLACAAESAGDS
jgi:2-keto-4-pentenoate hydratase/2-oxohepta-3-ene-1,7-dioic acid hydratase in catechol pathway